MTDVVVYDKAWATAITARIRKAGEDFGALLLEAHEGKAWKLAGYKSWAAYVDAEFDFARQYSYRLLKQERVNRQLADAGSPVRVTEREARDLSPTGDNTGGIHSVEQTVYERRAGPIQKPVGKKRRGPQGLDDKINRWRDERETLTEALEDADALDYLAADTRQRFEREAQRQFEFWSGIIARLSATERRPTRIDEWSA